MPDKQRQTNILEEVTKQGAGGTQRDQQTRKSNGKKKQKTDGSIRRVKYTASQSNSQSVSQPLSHAVIKDQSVSQSASRSFSYSQAESVIQLINQPVTQSAIQSDV